MFQTGTTYAGEFLIFLHRYTEQTCADVVAERENGRSSSQRPDRLFIHRLKLFVFHFAVEQPGIEEQLDGEYRFSGIPVLRLISSDLLSDFVHQINGELIEERFSDEIFSSGAQHAFSGSAVNGFPAFSHPLRPNCEETVPECLLISHRRHPSPLPR